MLNFNKVYIEQHETFPKQTLRNRTFILSANGIESISVPLVREKGIRETTKEIKICHKDHWAKKAWRSITSAYGKSPYFEYFQEDIQGFFSEDYTYLFELNNAILSYFSKRFAINSKVLYTEEFVKPQNQINDFRSVFNSQKEMNEQFSDSYFIPYTQCFCNKFPFQRNLSCLDLLLMEGSESYAFLKK